MYLASTRNVGLPTPLQPPPTGSASLDMVLQGLLSDLAAQRRAWGILLRPSDDIRLAVQSCQAGDTIVLLPGVYTPGGAVTVDKRVRIVGVGALVQRAGVVMSVTADDAEIIGVQFERTDRVAASPALLLSGAGTIAKDCTVKTASGIGIQVAATADYASVQGCKFLPSSSHVAGDSDVYWSDGATNGTACGNMWSRTAATFVLDYRAIDNMSEAANGVAGIINVR